MWDHRWATTTSKQIATDHIATTLYSHQFGSPDPNHAQLGSQAWDSSWYGRLDYLSIDVISSYLLRGDGGIPVYDPTAIWHFVFCYWYSVNNLKIIQVVDREF